MKKRGHRSRVRFLAVLALASFLLPAGVRDLSAGGDRIFRCADSEAVRRALDAAGPGDTILLEGGRVYEIDGSFRLRASGSENRRISLTSEDPSGEGRYAIISTVGGKKGPDLVALRVGGSFWTISRLEISGRKVPLENGFWDIGGFQLGIYLLGPGSHHNVIEDVHIHHTHNAAVAVRDESHHNVFRRMKIHDIGEWLDDGYNAHEAEGFYLGSSKGTGEAGNKARIHDILIENSILGPGLLGQFVDIKYGASRVTVRNNVLHCDQRTYNEEIVKLAGFDNLIENNQFVGSNPNLSRYIHLFNKKTRDPVRVDFQGQMDIPAPTGRSNRILNNVFYTDDPGMVAVRNDVAAGDRSTILIENNRIEPLTKWTQP